MNIREWEAAACQDPRLGEPSRRAVRVLARHFRAGDKVGVADLADIPDAKERIRRLRLTGWLAGQRSEHVPTMARQAAECWINPVIARASAASAPSSGLIARRAITRSRKHERFSNGNVAAAARTISISASVRPSRVSRRLLMTDPPCCGALLGKKC